MYMTRPSRPSAQGPSGRGPSRLSTRGGTLAIAGLATLLAAVALMVFLRQYRTNLTGTHEVRALVAKSLIPKGTPGRVVGERQLYKAVKIERSQLEKHAITDAKAFGDNAVQRDVYPGHQLTADDFVPTENKILERLSGYQRAINVPVDGARGLVGHFEAGDRVDVMGTQEGRDGTPAIARARARTLARNVLVLAVPSKPKSGGIGGASQSVTLRVPDDAASVIAGNADGGKIWVVLRPPVGARSHASSSEAAERALANGKEAQIEIHAKVRRAP